MTPRSRKNPGSGFGGPQYPGTFLLALREALANLNWQPVTWKGSSVDCLDPQGKSQEIGFENMYRRLRGEPRERWPALLTELLGSVPPEVAAGPGDLHEVADRLLVRLGPPIAGQSADADVWSLTLVEDHLAASLVIDYPSSMSYVTGKMIADSDQDADYWYERALANLRGKSDSSCLQAVHDESGLLQSQVRDAYDSSRALLLDFLLPGHEQNGFYVIVPARDHLLTVPINAESMMVAPWLRTIAAKMHSEVPYPISPELYWVRDGVWHRFTIEPAGDDWMVKPPPEFMEVMQRLRPDDAPPDQDGGSSPIV